jgi:hypothetical protein
VKILSSFLFHLLIILCLVLNSPCSWASERADKYLFVGCTPGDELIKSQLGITAETKIDFIKWDLTLSKLNQSTFVLNIIYGESQPNTLGFKQGGQKKSYQGEYFISKNRGIEIYQLKSNQLQSDIEIMKLNANILHFLTPQKQLMIGNGGWSYTLNNKNPDKNNYPLPKLTTATNLINDTSLQVVYDGRTPCQDFAAENKMNVNPSCFKLKWKLTLNRDAVNHNPTTYTIRKVVDGVPRDIAGNWSIIKGTESNPGAIIYQLDPDKPDQTISLFVADKNILFFLHKDNNMFVGNDNFSFTLNKRIGLDK